jgi:hypothetical protein
MIPHSIASNDKLALRQRKSQPMGMSTWLVRV